MHELTHHARTRARACVHDAHTHTHTLDEEACSHLQSNYCPLLLRGEEVSKAMKLESRRLGKIMC